MPLKRSEVEPRAFTDGELLYRRVAFRDLNSEGELDPSSLNSMSFGDEIDGAPSVLRSAFAVAEDALAAGCANSKDVTQHVVYELAVVDLPAALSKGGSPRIRLLPMHHPLELCGAHSVIAACKAGDEHRIYVVPSKAVRNDLRVKLATKMKRASY